MLRPPTRTPTLRETFGITESDLPQPLIPRDSRVVLEIVQPIPGLEWAPPGSFVVIDPSSGIPGQVVVELTASDLQQLLSHRCSLSSALVSPASGPPPQPDLQLLPGSSGTG